jgi:hypothetical protein
VLLPTVEEACHLCLKVSASCVSVVSRAVTLTRNKLPPSVNKEVSVAEKGVCSRVTIASLVNITR